MWLGVICVCLLLGGLIWFGCFCVGCLFGVTWFGSSWLVGVLFVACWWFWVVCYYWLRLVVVCCGSCFVALLVASGFSLFVVVGSLLV